MYWNWKTGGVALALTFLLAVAWVKPIGVSTQFVILDGIIADFIDPSFVYEHATTKTGYGSDNAYLNKSGGKYASAVANPLNYGFLFVLSMVLGGFIARWLFGHRGAINQVPAVHQQRFGYSTVGRYLLAFVGGVLVLWGARLAGGCTSGHMMSGMMQTSISGYLFAAAAFAVAIPTSMLLYRKRQ